MEEQNKLSQEELQELNRKRSTGSAASVDSVDLGDPLEELLQDAADPAGEPAADQQAGSIHISAVVDRIQQAIAREQGAIGKGKGYEIIRGSQGEPDRIFLEQPEYDPALDPNRQEFDPVKWKAVYDKAQLPDSVREDFTRGIAHMVSAALQTEDPEAYRDIISASTKAIADAVEQTYGAIGALSVLGAHFPEAGEDAALTGIEQAAINGYAAALSSAVDAAETLKIVLSPDFATRLQNTILELASALTPEELDALKEEIRGQEEPAADENQITLFETPGEEKPAADKPIRRKRKPRLERLVEQGLETILQNNSTNALTKFTGKNVAIDPVTGEAAITRGNFILKIPHYKELQADLKTSTWQLLDALTLKLTANPRKKEEPTVKLTLDEYMQRRGLKDRKAAKEQAVADMDILKSVSFTLEEIKGSGKKKDTVQYRFVNLADSGSVEKNGDIIFTYGSSFHRDLINGQIMAYSPALLQVNNHRNPNSYYLGRKISELKNMNALHRNAGNIISVNTLLQNAPYIPSYEEVAATNRNFTGRIIEPFERDLNALQDAFSWEYCHENGRPLTEEELEDFSYEVFIACNVKFTWHEYPDQTRRKEALDAKVEQAKAADKKKRGRPKKTKAAE